jgi:hypothetical protein
VLGPVPLLALLAAAAPGAEPPCGLPPLTGARPFAPGEALSLDLTLLGAVHAGEASLAVGRPMSAGQVWPLEARFRADGLPGVGRLVAVALSWVDAGSLRPERYSEVVDEGGRRRTTDARLSPPGPEVVLQATDRGAASSSRFPRERDTLDPLSALAWLRSARLRPGDPLCLDLVAAGRLWRVRGRVAPRTEPVATGAGSFQALRIEGTGQRADDPSKTRRIWLWLSDDARRLPLAVVSEIDLGPVSARLEAVRGGRP